MLYNINPNLWGKYFWGTIHFITFSYSRNPTQQEKDNVKKFIEILKDLLPCEQCRYHYEQNLKKFPLTDEILSSKIKLIQWAVDVHNEVNSRTGKKILTMDETINLYINAQPKEESNLSNCYNYLFIEQYNQIIYTLLLITIIIVLMYYVKFK